MTIKAAAWALLATGLSMALAQAGAQAGEVPQERTWDSPRALVSAGGLNVRAQPSLASATIAVLPRAWPVAILEDDGPALTIGGRADRWTYVATFRCTDEPCEHYEAGWVANSYLALDDRFALLKDGPAGIVAGYDTRSVFAYDISKNGEFIRWRLPCSAGSCSTAVGVTPHCELFEELALGSVCVLSGTLHRHGGLVRGRSRHGGWLDRQDVTLVVEASGSLCPLDPAKTGQAGGCARTDRQPSPDEGPAVAIARLAEERRQALALTATGRLNLRASPSFSGEILARLPMASAVERRGGRGLPVILNGRADEWVQVSVVECAGPESCRAGLAGWVMDSFLAYEDRLTEVTELPEPVRSGNQGFGFEVAADGTFRHWEACGTGEFGLEICTRTGRLYRYRDLIVLRDNRGEVYSGFLAGAGTLCMISSATRHADAEACKS